MSDFGHMQPMAVGMVVLIAVAIPVALVFGILTNPMIRLFVIAMSVFCVVSWAVGRTVLLAMDHWSR